MKTMAQPLTMMLVDDNPADRRYVMHHIQRHIPDIQFIQADTVANARKNFDPESVDFVMLDYHLPDGTGLEVMEHILKLSQFVPIVLLTGLGDEELAVQALQLGASDYLNKDRLDQARVKQAIENSIERRNVEAKIYHLAHYDQLTHIFNRAHFESRLHLALQRAERYKKHIAVLFMDLDGFKTINDTYGHDIGDQILIEVANRLKCCIRDVDTVARFGGDEFAVILEELSSDKEDSCAMVGQRILNSICRPFEIKGHILNIGISIGVAIHSNRIKQPEMLIKMADAAMYEAKTTPQKSHLRFSQCE